MGEVLPFPHIEQPSNGDYSEAEREALTLVLTGLQTFGEMAQEATFSTLDRDLVRRWERILIKYASILHPIARGPSRREEDGFLFID